MVQRAASHFHLPDEILVPIDKARKTHDEALRGPVPGLEDADPRTFR